MSHSWRRHTLIGCGIVLDDMTDTPQDDQSNINPYTRKRGRRGKSGWLFVVGFVVMSLVLYVLFIWIASAFGTGPSNYFR